MHQDDWLDVGQPGRHWIVCRINSCTRGLGEKVWGGQGWLWVRKPQQLQLPLVERGRVRWSFLWRNHRCPLDISWEGKDRCVQGQSVRACCRHQTCHVQSHFWVFGDSLRYQGCKKMKTLSRNPTIDGLTSCPASSEQAKLASHRSEIDLTQQ